MNELRQKARSLEPVMRIGKKGVTENVYKEIIRLLKKRKLIKIRFLRSCLERGDKKTIAKDIAEKTGSELVDCVGFTIVLAKKGKK